MNSISREHAEGAVAVTTALILVLLLSLAAFVVDLAVVRADNRSSQSAADHAVVAGAAQLGENSFADACATTWQYLTANISASASASVPASCTTVFAGMTKETCALRAGNSAAPTSDPTTDPALFGPLFMTEKIGEFTVTIQMPVRDGDELMGAQASDPDFDGTNPCERIGMRLARSRPGIFSSFAGGDGTNTGVIDAVARLIERGSVEEYATLIILDQVGCDALVTGGNGAGVVVFDGELDGAPSPGIITSDSNGSGCSNSANDAEYDTGGSGVICAGVSVVDDGVPPADDYLTVAASIASSGSCIRPTSSIRNDTLRSLAPASRYENPKTPNSIAPDVTAGDFWGRQQIDHDYNCVATYPAYSATTPQYPYDQGKGNPYTDVEGCTSGRDAAINLLISAFITNSLQTNVLFFTPITDCSDKNYDVTATPWIYLDCKNQGRVTLNGATLVVVNQFGGAQPGVKMSNGDRLAINPPAGKDAIMVVPTGGMSFPGGTLSLKNTFVYLHSGALAINSQASDTFLWSAPNLEKGWKEDGSRDKCQLTTKGSKGVLTLPNGLILPSAPCFEDLALWSNETAAHSFGGQANVNVAGIFFTPNAGRKNNSSFSLSGGGNGLDLTFAQFFTWRLSVSGSAAVIMQPDPLNFSSKPRYGSGLIR